ncbi:MAG: DNA polymerase III subunit gamma/tau [Oscillospiraceae bacterium]|nr:DNA polymerase III subunit gamma/tau [Oscillospiraceae bacterium]
MYQALYRKWRPKTFDEVVGQQHITQTLKNQIITGRLSHAYLFIGTRGTGKTSCAKILAKALNCHNPVNGNPCGKCPACLGIDDGSVLDVVEIDAASNNGVDNVRQLREEAVFSPVSVKKRVYIIDEVHMLSTPAFNALLKILEEPPDHLVFILATTEINKVPATILSRCQRHSFKRLDPNVIADHLEHVAKCEGLNLERKAAELIAGLAEGGMRDALSLLDQCSGAEVIGVDSVYSAMGLTGNRRTAQLLDFTVKRSTDSALLLFTELWSDGKDPTTLLGELNTLLRDCLMLSVAPKASDGLLSGRFSKDMLESFCKRLTKAEMLSRINTVSDYLARIRDSKSPRLTAELCIISLCDPTLIEGLDELRARVSRIEEDMKNAPRTAVFADEDDEDEEEYHSSLEDLPFDEAPPARSEAEPAGDEDDLDLSAFTEYQPEDDFLDKASPAQLNPDAAPAAENAPTDNAALWAAILERAEESLPFGIIPILTNPLQAVCDVEYDTLRLRVAPGFYYNTINKQDVLMRLREAANLVTGRSLKVQLSELSSEPVAPKRSLDELKKFKETRFI